MREIVKIAATLIVLFSQVSTGFAADTVVAQLDRSTAAVTEQPLHTIKVQDPMNDRYSLIRNGFKTVLTTLGTLTTPNNGPSANLIPGAGGVVNGIIGKTVGVSYSFRF